MRSEKNAVPSVASVAPVATVAPVAQTQRIQSLDIIRGFALMGILASNIQVFASAYVTINNPLAFGDISGLNLIVAAWTRIFVQSKFFPLFSMLFGAGIFLMTKKAEEKGAKADRIHIRRMMWLFVIGFFHVFLFWDGDILVVYGLAGVFVFLFRKVPARVLLPIALALIFFQVVNRGFVRPSNVDLTPGQLTARLNYWQPDQESLDRINGYYRGSWWKQTTARTTYNFFLLFRASPWKGLVAYIGWMLLGMALFKFGIFFRKFPAHRLKLMVLGLVVAVIFRTLDYAVAFAHDWDFMFMRLYPKPFSQFFLYNLVMQIEVILICTGYIAVLMLIIRSGKLQGLTKRLAAAGRMALTNYLMQSAICSAIFFSYGFGLFGYVDRSGQLLVILLIWILQLWYSPLWLKYFRFGPVEWMWRSLTYRKHQPMRQ